VFLFTRELDIILFAFIFSPSCSWEDFTIPRYAEALRLLVQHMGNDGAQGLSVLLYPLQDLEQVTYNLFLVFKFRC